MKPALPTTVPPSAPSTDLDQIPPPWSDIPQTWEDDGGGGAETLTSSTSFEVGSSSSDGDGSKQDSKRARGGKSPAGAVVPGPKLVKKGDPLPEPTPARLWHSQLVRNSTFRIISNLRNATMALEIAPEWAGRLGYNDFTQQIAILKPLPWGKRGGQWTDQETRMTNIWLQDNGFPSIGIETAGQAVLAVAMKNIFNPVLEYIDGLRWDGEGRLDGWLTRYLGVVDNDYTRTVGRLWMILGASRVLSPGGKADNVLILEGKQGSKKSTALRALMPNPDLFADDMPSLHNKDSQIHVHGPWLIELAELTTLSKSDSELFKAFISRQIDRFRRPYGKNEEYIPRKCFFAGTTNKEMWNKDETGGRRFWPVKTTNIDIEGLERDRDQLWAEATTRFKAGEKWWMDSEEMLAQAEMEQAARFEADAWQDSIAEWVENPRVGEECMFPLHSTPECITTSDLLSHCLGIYDRSRWSQGDQNRVARCMTALGWKKKNKRIGDVTFKAFFRS